MVEFAPHSLKMSLANMWNWFESAVAGHATESLFRKFQSRFAFFEGIPLCMVQPFRQTKSTNSFDSFMSISDVPTCNWRHDKIRIFKCLLWNTTLKDLMQVIELNSFYHKPLLLTLSHSFRWYTRCLEDKVYCEHNNPRVLHINKKYSTKVYPC